MAVVVSVAKGYDLGYIWKTQGQQASAARTPGGYCINAVQAGEPPGRWWGPGAQALGFTCGQVVERKPYDAVYQQRDPRTGAKLGRARGRYVTFADHLAQLKAAEPYATAERVIELEREAAQVTRQAAAYTDVTVSFSKSISVLHASIRENARQARLAGDGRALAYWSGREEMFQELLHRANRAALDYLQGWAGVTRTGYQTSDLAYAISGHCAHGATVHTGIALVAGTEDRQWLYPAMTRGTDANLAFVFTTPPKVADPRPGTQAAPELERYERIRRERDGFLSAQPAAGPGNLDPREPIAVLADVLDRAGAELSASEISNGVPLQEISDTVAISPPA